MQKFIKRPLRKIFNIFWLVLSTEEMWRMWRYVQQKPVAVQIKLWNWKWIRNTEEGFLYHIQTGFQL